MEALCTRYALCSSHRVSDVTNILTVLSILSIKICSFHTIFIFVSSSATRDYENYKKNKNRLRGERLNAEATKSRYISVKLKMFLIRKFFWCV